MNSGTTELSNLLEVGYEHHRAGRLGEAERVYREVLARYPRFPEVCYNLALLLQSQARLAEAEEALGAALEIRPFYPEALTALGNVVQGRDRPQEAVALYRRALELKPDAAQIHNNLGNALKSCDRLDEAVTHLEEAIRLQPRFVDAFYNLGNVLMSLGRAGDAVPRYRRALAMNPLNAAALNNLGSALKEQGRLEEAADCYRRAIALAPDFADPYHNLLFSLHYRADMAPAEIAGAHRDWAQRHVDPLAPATRPFAAAREPERRLRVGYVSPDLHEHPVATFFEPLLAAHDATGIESFCYADTPREDATSARLRAASDHWRMIRGLSSAVAAEQVRADAIDILVDLAGHTARNRLALFACRAAPIQITWLGYPATTGMAAMDYRLTDAVADPAGAEAHHSEALLRLPSGFLCYAPPDGAPDVNPPPAAAQDGISFGSFNNFTKLSPPTIRLWAQLLRAVPDSRLLLKAKQSADEETVERLRADFAAAGIERGRLRFLAPRPAVADHLAAYHGVDIALDPFPYNGTTTSCEAMWMGVPVISLRGAAHAGRVGASLLTRLDLTELIAEDEEAYVRVATGLARDRARLAGLRAGLRQRVRKSLCDANRFAREVEAAYRAVWRRWCGV